MRNRYILEKHILCKECNFSPTSNDNWLCEYCYEELKKDWYTDEEIEADYKWKIEIMCTPEGEIIPF